MEILLSVGKGADDGIESLLMHLRAQAGLAGKVRLASLSEVDGAMGPGADAIAVALGSGGTVTVLAACLRAWIKAYYAQRKKDVRVEIQDRHGAKLVIDIKNADDSEAVLRQALEAAAGTNEIEGGAAS